MQKGFTMKNIHTLLSEIGFTVSEDKKVDFEKAFADNYKTVSEVEKLRTSRDNYKSQLETAQTALKKFEGVNVEELKGEIKKLNGDLAAKETCRILPSYIFIIRCYIGIRCSLGLLPFNTLGNK